MSTKHPLPLPQDLRTEFEVVDESRSAAGNTWLLRDVATRNVYLVAPGTVADWDIPPRPDNKMRPRVTIARNGHDVIALELKTGLVYRDYAPIHGLVELDP